MNKIIFILSIFFGISSASAETNITIKDGIYTAIGYSDKESELLAQQDACNNARRNLIEYVFGTAYQVNQNTVRTLGVISYSQDISTQSDVIQLVQVISEITQEKNGLKKCTLSYPKEEADSEKNRLKQIKPGSKIHFNEVGNASHDNSSGILEIITIPGDAEILIDNKRWGSAPLRIAGGLSVGTHRLRIDHPDFKPIEKEFTMGQGGTQTVKEILDRATGKLSINTNPAGATVKINGQDVGHSPVSDIEVLSGKKLQIEIEHPEAEAFSQSISVDRDVIKPMNINLPLKPAYISLNSDPADAFFTLDKKPAQSNQWISVAPGEHIILATKSGYADEKISINVRGGEKKALPTIKLKSLSEVEKTAKEQEAYLYNPPWRFLISMAFSGNAISNGPSVRQGDTCCAGWEFGLERKFFNTVGLNIKSAGLTSTETSSGSSQSPSHIYERHDLSLSLPIYFDRSLYIAPEYGRSSGTVALTSGSASVKQNFYGLSTGLSGTVYGRWGAHLNAGYRKYSEDELYKGASTFIINIGLLIGF